MGSGLCRQAVKAAGGFEISDSHLKSALSTVRLLTGLHGRWETLSKHPLTICDTGHNPEGIKEVMQNIAAVPYNKLHFVIGVVNDKDISKILAMLPKDAIYYRCKPWIFRVASLAENLKQQAQQALAWAVRFILLLKRLFYQRSKMPGRTTWFL